MMKKSSLLLAPALALGAIAMFSSPAMAAQGHSVPTESSGQSWSYQTELGALNGSGGSGNVMITVNGNQAHVKMNVSGLAKTFNGNPYPHVEHIHIDGGSCPAPSADKNGDGIVDTVEGQPAYGMIGTTLSTKGDTSAKAALDLKVAGMGGSYTYDRTFTLNDKTATSIKAGTASVVVHGLDPATLSKKAAAAKSNLNPDLPLAASAPALCGTLVPSQMAQMPNGAADTGVAHAESGNDTGMFIVGGSALLLLAAGGTYAARRHTAAKR